MNIKFDAATFKGDLLKQIGAYVNDQANTNSKGVKTLASRIQDGRVRLAGAGVEQTGKNGHFGRTEGDKQLNNEMRQAFVEALKSELGLKGTDNKLLDTLEKLFGRGVFKKDDYNVGKPLTMRRITAVLNKFSDVKAKLDAERAIAKSEEIVARYTEVNGRVRKEVKAIKVALMKAAASEGFSVRSCNAEMNAKIKTSFLELVGKTCNDVLEDNASCISIDRLCKEALQENGMASDFGKVKAFREMVLAQLSDPDALEEQLANLASDADECIKLRAENPFGNFAMRYDREEANLMIAQFRALMPEADDRDLGKYALIAFRLRADADLNDFDVAGEFAFKVKTLRNYGVGDEAAEKLFNVGNLNTGIPEPRGKIHYTIKDFNHLVNHSFGNALKVVFGSEFKSAEYLQACLASFGKLPRFGEKVEAAYEAVAKSVKAMEDLGPALMKRVNAALPNATTAEKIDAYLQTVEDARKKVMQMASKGRFDIDKAVAAAKIPTADKLAPADEKRMVKAMRTMMVKYLDEFIKRDGNINNRKGFNSSAANMLDAVLKSFDKLTAMLEAKPAISKAIEKATAASVDDPSKPCYKYKEGKALTRILEDCMDGAGSHGDTQGITQIGSAAVTFFKIPELFIKALERDAATGTNESIRDFAYALNTDGCVQAYSRALLDLEVKLDKVEEYDLGRKTDDLAMIFGKAFDYAFPDLLEAGTDPISYDTFAHRLANFLGRQGYGTAEARYAELLDRKDEFMDYLDGRPVVA